MKDPNENRPGYKLTKVGWIPEEWECESIVHSAPLQTGYPFSSDDYTNAEPSIRLLRGDNVSPSAIRWDDAMRLSTEKASKHSVYNLDAGDIVLAMDRPWISDGIKVAIVTDSDVPSLLVQRVARLRPNNRHLASFYTSHLLTQRFETYIKASQQEGGGVPHISAQQIKDFAIGSPPLGERLEIAAILSACDKSIERTRDLIAAKKQQKKAVMQQLLTGKKQLPGFKEKWTRCKIGEMFKEVTRPVDWDDEHDYSLLSVRRRSGGVFLRERLRGTQIATKVMFVAHAGDFLISKMQVLHGATGLVPDDLDGCHISGSYIALRPNGGKPIEPKFFARLSEMAEFRHLTYLCSYGVHIEKMTFNVDWFLRSEILIPPTGAEQQAIVELLDAADSEIASLEAKLVALRQQKKGLMQKLLTGEIRVKP